MNKDEENRQTNSDQRIFKAATTYSDKQSGYISRLIDELGLTKLARPRISWTLPKYVRFKYSTVSDEHKQAEKRRKQGYDKRRSTKQRR